MEFNDQKYGVIKDPEPWPPPPGDILESLTESIRDYEEQRTHAEDQIARLKASNEAYKKRCHHYEKQIATYETVIDGWYPKARYYD